MRFREEIAAEQGFTLVELLVFMGIMIILLIGIGSMLTSAVSSSSASYNLVKVTNAANEALSTMVRQIRVAMALSPLSDAGSIYFAGDIDGDASGGDAGWEEVKFDASDGYLRKGVLDYGSGEPEPVDWIEGCDQVIFTYFYYDDTTKQVVQLDPADAGQWNAHVNEVSRVDIELQMSREAAGTVDIERSVKGSVSLRNQLIDVL